MRCRFDVMGPVGSEDGVIGERKVQHDRLGTVITT